MASCAPFHRARPGRIVVAVVAGSPLAARAVGTAMAENRFAPLIPCHRVVGSDGALHGYGGGLKMKQALLLREKGPR